VAKVASELGLPMIKANVLDEAVLAELKNHRIELGIVVAFGVFLKPKALAYLSKGWFNLHYSLLPKWRGAAPVQHALLAGEVETGVTLFRIDEGMDTGPIICQLPTRVLEGESAGSLLDRLTHLGVSVLTEYIPRILAGFVEYQPQSNSDATLAPKLHKEDARLDFTKSANHLQNIVNAMNPEPGAWSLMNGIAVKIHEARAIDFNVEVGSLKLLDDRLLVGCGVGALELVVVQPAGKNRMSAKDWFRGLPDKAIHLGNHE
jgi:methionyl-tRNA formyltransferase